jgi:ribonuclease P protein subunit POP4
MKEKTSRILIGREIEITESRNKSLIGKKGKVIEETQNTITIQEKEKETKIIKTHVKIKIPETKEEIEGKKLARKIKNRI